MSAPLPRVTRRGARLDWVKFDADLARDGSVQPVDKALYAAIASFVDAETRESPVSTDLDLNVIPVDVPTRKRLAACIGKSVDTVDRSTKRLEDRGLLKVHRQADPNNPRLSVPSEYELLDHELWDQKAADRAARREARRKGLPAGEGGGRMDAATPGRASAATPGRMGAAVEEEREVEEENGGESAALPRSGDVRRTSTSGSKGLGEGGFAASGKSKPSHLTREQRQQVQAVRQLLPGDLNSALPEGTPRNVADAILGGLAAGQPRERTVEQLVEFRVMRRWDGYWASKFYAGELGKDPFGPLLAMVEDTAECGSLACEDRFDIFTGEACAACEQRTVDKRADREGPREHPAMSEPAATVPKQTVVPMQCCEKCDRGFRSPTPGLCRSCITATVNV